jgi:hypothetical protein
MSNLIKRNSSYNLQGDWGTLTTRIIALRYPNHCKAHHINMIIAAEPTWTAENPKPEYTIEEQGYITKQKGWATGDERGYSAIQSTKVTKPTSLSQLLQLLITSNTASNTRIRPPRLPRSTPRMDLREASRLDRLLSLDSRRNHNMDQHLLFLNCRSWS